MESVGNNQFKVGVFIVIGLVIVLLSILLVGGDRMFFRRKVVIYAEFDQVQGLGPGSVVSLAGITVGNIEAIDFNSNSNRIQLKLKIDADFLSRITEGTTAEIRTQGALGDKFIYISPGEPSGRQLGAGANLPMQKATDLIGVISERGKEADKIFEIINELYKLVKTINADNRIGVMIGNMSDASKSLKVTAGESEKLVAELRSQSGPKIKDSMEKLDRILTKIDRGEGTLGALINDSGLHDSLKAMLGSSTRKKNIKSLLRDSIEKGEEIEK